MIKQIAIKNFIGFKSFDAVGLSSVNIIVGPNDCGKTGLLKILYATIKSYEEYHAPLDRNYFLLKSFSKTIEAKLSGVFEKNIDQLHELTSNFVVFDHLSLSLKVEDESAENEIAFDLKDLLGTTIGEGSSKKENLVNTVFIPSKEVLSIAEIIRASREGFYENGFDDTYYDLVKKIGLRKRSDQQDKYKDVVEKLEQLIGGKIVRSEKHALHFVFKKKDTFQEEGKEYPMSLTAEGYKQIGVLLKLIENGTINDETIVFMDEPETSLHPKAIRLLAEVIYSISKTGTQFFITSHSYFLIKQLEIIAKREKQVINCISLDKIDNEVVTTISDLALGLPDNAIIRESLAMFDDEINLAFS